MMEFKERVAWVLNIIKEREKLNNIQLSKILGVDKNTIQAYTHAKADIKGSALSSLVKEYRINGAWIISGIGEPFPGAREKFPEICGNPDFTVDQYNQMEECLHNYTREAIVSHDSINIDEAWGKAYKVLKAGTALSVALYMNIQQFAAALDAGEDLKRCRQEIADLREELQKLRQEVNRFTAHSTVERQDDGSEKEAI